MQTLSQIIVFIKSRLNQIRKLLPLSKSKVKSFGCFFHIRKGKHFMHNMLSEKSSFKICWVYIRISFNIRAPQNINRIHSISKIDFVFVIFREKRRTENPISSLKIRINVFFIKYAFLCSNMRSDVLWELCIYVKKEFFIRKVLSVGSRAYLRKQNTVSFLSLSWVISTVEFVCGCIFSFQMSCYLF